MGLIAWKLDPKSGMDIGCGWETLCQYRAVNYQVECVGVTVGEEGAKYARNICKGLPVDIRVQDYREVREQFDRIVSVGMFEHVAKHSYTESRWVEGVLKIMVYFCCTQLVEIIPVNFQMAIMVLHISIFFQMVTFPALLKYQKQ